MQSSRIEVRLAVKYNFEVTLKAGVNHVIPTSSACP